LRNQGLQSYPVGQGFSPAKIYLTNIYSSGAIHRTNKVPA